jgi:hypothetical protein
VRPPTVIHILAGKAVLFGQSVAVDLAPGVAPDGRRFIDVPVDTPLDSRVVVTLAVYPPNTPAPEPPDVRGAPSKPGPAS